jgi:bZIP transcription factor
MDEEADPNPYTVSEESASSHNGDNSGHDSDKDDGDAGSDSADFELDPDKRREARKMRRVMANRRSARESRERRKKLLTDLQDSVENLTAENASLTKENLALRKELAGLLQQSGLTGANAGNLSNLAWQLPPQPPQAVGSNSSQAGGQVEGDGSVGGSVDEASNNPKVV